MLAVMRHVTVMPPAMPPLMFDVIVLVHDDGRETHLWPWPYGARMSLN